MDHMRLSDELRNQIIEAAAWGKADIEVERIDEGKPDFGGNKGDESKTDEGEEDYTTKKGKKKKTTSPGRGEKKGDEAFKNEAIVNEVAKRVAARLAKQNQKDAMADQLAERIMARLVK